MRKSSSFTWLTFVAGLALGLAGLRDHAPAYRSLAPDRTGVEHEIPAPRAHDPGRLRLAPQFGTERSHGPGDSIDALPARPAAAPALDFAAPSRGRPRSDPGSPSGERLPYLPRGPPLSL